MRRTWPSSEGTTTSTMSFGVSGPDMRRLLSLALLSVRSSTQRGQQPMMSTRSPMEVSRCKMVSAGVNPEYHDRGNALEALAVVWAPVSALARVTGERRVLLGFGVVALYAGLQLVINVMGILGGASAFVAEDFSNLPPEFVEGFSQVGKVAIVISAVLSRFIGWIMVSLLMQLVTRFFGGTGPLSGMFAAVGVAAVPLVIASAVEVPVTGLQIVLGPDSTGATLIDALVGLLFVAAYAWNIVLVVIGAAFARRIGYGEAAGSCAGCAGLILIVGVFFGVLVAVLL